MLDLTGTHNLTLEYNTEMPKLWYRTKRVKIKIRFILVNI